MTSPLAYEVVVGTCGICIAVNHAVGAPKIRCERALVQGKGDIDPHSHASSPRLCGEKGSSTL